MRATSEGETRGRPVVELAVAGTLAAGLFGTAMLKAVAMSAPFDPNVSLTWRRRFARVEWVLGSRASDDTGPSSREHAVGLLPGMRPGGWLGGRANDLSDHQWRTFRRHLPLLVVLMLATVPVVAAVRRRAPNASVPFHAVYGCVFVSCLHGAKVAWIVSLALVHLGICRAAAGVPRVGPIAVWMSAIGCLLAVQTTADDWSFEGAATTAARFLGSSARYSLPGIGRAMDGAFGGVMPRWWVHFNLVTLRFISYGLDLHWNRRRGADNRGDAVRKNKEKVASSADATVTYAQLVEDPSPAVRYSVTEYVAYLFYPPLYIAGPIGTFNAFASQVHHPQRTHSVKDIARYAVVKFGIIVLLTEVWTHTVYSNAMALSHIWRWAPVGPVGGKEESGGVGGRALEGNSSRLGDGGDSGFGPLEVAVLALTVLNFMWLKFAVIWRFFRLWALMSGVEVPENMLRCVNNNATILGFWKGWHASYNRWLVRYLYVPLGGSRYKLLNVWVVFGFVGMWHDRLGWRLIHWAAIFALFLAPELGVEAAGRVLFPTPMARDTHVYRLARSIVGAVNVHVLIVGNLVGYVVGLDGVRELLGVYVQAGRRGVAVVAVTLAAFTAHTHLGFEQRAGEERRRGFEVAAAEEEGEKKKTR